MSRNRRDHCPERINPKFFWGDFAVFYEFQEPRPRGSITFAEYEQENLDVQRLHRSDYSGENKIPRPYGLQSRSLYSNMSDIIQCPGCSEGAGGLEHGMRARCYKCGIWLETYGNSLAVWHELFWIRCDGGTKRYFYNGEEISEKDYISLRVYHKLL